MPATKQTKTKSTRQKNIEDVITNKINNWSRPDTFTKQQGKKKVNIQLHIKAFNIWEAWWNLQLHCRFQHHIVAVSDRIDEIGLGRHSEARDNFLIDHMHMRLRRGANPFHALCGCIANASMFRDKTDSHTSNKAHTFFLMTLFVT